LYDHKIAFITKIPRTVIKPAPRNNSKYVVAPKIVNGKELTNQSYISVVITTIFVNRSNKKVSGLIAIMNHLLIS